MKTQTNQLGQVKVFYQTTVCSDAYMFRKTFSSQKWSVAVCRAVHSEAKSKIIFSCYPTDPTLMNIIKNFPSRKNSDLFHRNIGAPFSSVWPPYSSDLSTADIYAAFQWVSICILWRNFRPYFTNLFKRKTRM